MDNGKRVTRSNSSHAELASSIPPATEVTCSFQLADLKSEFELKC
jgi:hypothetical protein